MRGLYFEAFGGPSVLTWGDLPDPVAGPHEVIVRARAIGLNFADIYRRRGTYHLAGSPPWVLGYEAAGVVEAVGPRVVGLAVGDRVAFADVPRANAERVRANEEHVVTLPDDVAFETAAALLLQGLTAQYLTRDSHALRRGEVAVVHAAAGGVGLLLVQLAKLAGAMVLGLASTAEKRDVARAYGADDVLGYDGDWAAAVRERTPDGRGADVVYDAVGSTLEGSLAAARRGGRVVFYGMAGGDPAPVDPRRLMDESKTLTGGDLWNVLTSRRERIDRAAALFELVRTGRLRVALGGTYPLSRGAEAHAFLEGRSATGKIILTA